MTTPFVTELRSTDDVIVVEGQGTVLHLRVQAAELWDAMRVDAPAGVSFATVKQAALSAFFPAGAAQADYVGKVRGFEILHENQSIESCGIRDGSTILLARRRRRPVK